MNPTQRSGPTLARPISVTAADEEELRAAMESYRKRSGRMFPTWSEILEILRGIGYAKRVWRPVGPIPSFSDSI